MRQKYDLSVSVGTNNETTIETTSIKALALAVLSGTAFETQVRQAQKGSETRSETRGGILSHFCLTQNDIIRQYIDSPLPETYPYERLCQSPGLGGKFAACRWSPPAEWAEFERKHRMPADMRGMGIDAYGLPEVLRGFSVTGWRLELAASGRVEMIAVAGDARNEDGNRDYLRVMRDKIRVCLECLNGVIAMKNSVLKCRACKQE